MDRFVDNLTLSRRQLLTSAAVGGVPVVYNAQVEIRQLIIDWVSAAGTIDPSVFATLDWRLVSNGQPITISTA